MEMIRPAGKTAFETVVPLLTEEQEAELDRLRPHACFFTGHRNLPAEHLARFSEVLYLQTEALVYQGFDVFLCGGARGFDLCAAGAVLRLKRNHPSLRLVLALPCPGQTKGWQNADRELYDYVCAHAEAFLLSEHYDGDCMRRRNYFLVDHAAAGLAYDTGIYRSGTAQTTRYAASRHIPVINIADLLAREEAEEREQALSSAGHDGGEEAIPQQKR